MTTIEHTSSMMRVSRTPAWVRIVNLLAMAVRSYRNRRAVYQLGELSDLELADIGLRRVDLHLVRDTPFGVDPTERLSRIASARNSEALARQVH